MDKEKKKAHEEKRQKLKDALVCKHSSKKHPSKKEEECWELDANVSFHPANWKSTKEQEIAGSIIEIEFWQPGRVLDKLKSHTHLDTRNYWTPLEEEDNEVDNHPQEVHQIKNITVDDKEQEWGLTQE